jgi:dTDP-4-dehydrorhamnose reductase
MRIAVTGTTGRVGAALARHFSARHQIIALPRTLCDLADPQSLAISLAHLECDVFVNPAGLTSLEACEDDPALAMRINAEAPAEIAKWAAIRGIPVIHFSTDYVFGGQIQGLREENELTAPVNVYGRSKLAGEIAILENPTSTVIRVSWVFGPEKASFIDQIFDHALAGRPLAAVADKFSLPTFTQDLSRWVECLIEQRATGIFHACNSGAPVSWHDMATVVIEEMVASGVLSSLPDIRKQTLHEMTSFRAERPRFTAMNTQRLTGILGHSPRPWREALTEHVACRCSLL